MKFLIFLIISLIIFSCSPQNKKIIKKKRKPLPVKIYIPQNPSLVIKNNKYNSILFDKNYDKSVKYEFIYKKQKYILTTSKPQTDYLKLSSCYLTPVTTYQVGKFNKDMDNFDFFYNGNLFRIISLNPQELILLSTGNTDISMPFQKLPEFVKESDAKFIIQEENPLFFEKVVKTIKFKYKFKSLSSYLLIMYNSIKKTYMDKEKTLSPNILIITLKNFDEIERFKKKIIFKMLIYETDLKTIFSNKEKTIYIIFDGDKIIFLNNVNIYDFLEKLKKIPLTRIKKINVNQGYIFAKDINTIKKIFKIFEKITFNGYIKYYFFDFREEK